MDNVAKLAHLLSIPPKTIELIPGNGEEWLDSFPDNPHAPFLFVEGNLGVPEKTMYKAYMVAAKALGEPGLLRRALQQPGADDLQSDEYTRAMNLTSVILLANPAHQSALNIRKTFFIRPRLSSTVSSEREQEMRNVCIAELGFIQALLTVKQCAKVSMLWHHRRFLLSRLCAIPSLICNSNSDSEARKGNTDQNTKIGFDLSWTCCTDDHFSSRIVLPTSVLQTELAISSRACEVYPRNYFAWYHRWLCIDPYLNAHTHRPRSGSSGSPTPLQSGRGIKLSEMEGAEEVEIFLRKEVDIMKLWIERHVSDYSAVDYICRVAEALDNDLPRRPRPCIATPTPVSKTDSDVQSQPDSDSDESATSYTSELFQHALTLVQSYPSYEALWLYLRRTLQLFSTSKHPRLPTTSDSEHDPIEEVAAKITDDLVRSILNDASRKCQDLSGTNTRNDEEEQSSNGLLRIEIHTIVRNALRFILWRRLRNGQRDKNLSVERDEPESILSLACSHFREMGPNTLDKHHEDDSLMSSSATMEDSEGRGWRDGEFGYKLLQGISAID